MSGLSRLLNKVFIEECLRVHDPNDNIQVQQLEILPTAAKGENFLSSIIRMNVTYYCVHNNEPQVRTKRLLCKIGLEEKSARDKIAILNFYNKEMNMYEYILPQIKLLLQGINADEHIFAEAIKIARDHDVIIFQDLGMYDFAMSKRQNGFDRTHAQRILSNLA